MTLGPVKGNVMECYMQNIVEELRAFLPPVFAGTSIDDLTGGAIRWRTIQNKRSLREIPDECFIRAGAKVLVRRDPFLDWWATTLAPTRAVKPVTASAHRAA